MSRKGEPAEEEDRGSRPHSYIMQRQLLFAHIHCSGFLKDSHHGNVLISCY